MLKLSFGNSLGQALRLERKKKKLTQELLALSSGLSPPTIRLLEKGRGRMGSFFQVLKTLELELAGRNLPRGDTLGERLALLRRRREMSQRQVASILGISQPTLIALEVSERGRLETLENVGTLLGAGFYLIAKGAPKDFYTHAGQSSVWHKWHTPPSVLHRL